MVSNRTISVPVERCGCNALIGVMKGSKGFYAVNVPDERYVCKGDDVPAELVGYCRLSKSDFHSCEKVEMNLSGIRDFMFGGAGRKKVLFQLHELKLSAVQFALAADGKKIWVTDGGPFGDNRFFGGIDVETGEFRNTGFPMSDMARRTIELVNEGPVEAAKAHAKVMGECCFCKSPLTDAVSLANGYGPVCAKKWGMPWIKVVGGAVTTAVA